jgi:acyl-CoA thioesterase-1
MFRSSIRIVLLFLVFVLSLPAGAATVLVVGDSLSAGYGLRREDAWPTLLQQRLSQSRPDWQVFNASISGDTTANGRSRLPALLRAQQPGLVVLALGANDGLRGQPPQAMADNLSAMIDDARKSGARVLLVGMRLPPNYGPAYSRKFEQAFRDVAEHHRIPLVPFLLDGFAGQREMFQDDMIHPTAEAQPLILETVWKGLAPLLK